nr:hypothetical protein RVX_2907 [Nitratidesulfovibrio sp. HK-II]
MPQGGEDGEAWRVDGRGIYEDGPTLLTTLDFVMPPAVGNERGRTLLGTASTKTVLPC